MEGNCETEHQTPSFGLVKVFDKEKGFGFIINEYDKEYKEDIFFHVKQTKGEVKDGDRVYFFIVDSKKHLGKKEAKKVRLLEGIKDFRSLILFFIKTEMANLQESYYKLSGEKSEFHIEEKIFHDVIDSQLSNIQDIRILNNASNLVALINDHPFLSINIKVLLVKKLLFQNDHFRGRIYLEGFPLLKEEGDEPSSEELIKGFYLIPNYRKDKKWKELNIALRIKIKRLEKVSSEATYDQALEIISIKDEDINFNLQELKKNVIIEPYFLIRFWLEDIAKEIDLDNLKEKINDLPFIDLKKIFLKLPLDENIKLFPIKLIEKPSHFDLFKIIVEDNNDKKKAYDAALLGGIKLTPHYVFQSWLLGYSTEVSLDILQFLGFNESIEGKQDIIRMLGWKKSLELFNNILSSDLTRKVKFIITSSEDFDKENDSSRLIEVLNLGGNDQVDFWLEDIILPPDLSIICNYILNHSDDVKAEKALTNTPDLIEKILEGCFYLLSEKEITTEEERVFTFLKRVKNLLPERFEIYSSRIAKLCSTYIQVSLWIKELSSYFDFPLFSPYLITLSSEEQKKFIKKTFWEIRAKNLTIPIQEIINLKHSVIDIELGRMLQGENNKIDYTVYVILQAIEEVIQNGEILKPEKMYHIIANQITSPDDMLSLNGFFDKCQGRLGHSRGSSGDSNPNYFVDKKRSSIPRFILYCEGRKAVDKKTGKEAKCELTDSPFWWCSNLKCFSNCINNHEDWEEFTFKDLLDILKISFSQSEYEIFLGYINKVNHFLSHMKCLECNYILRPVADDKKTSNYAFHRVNNFYCTNTVCGKKEEVIYLSHCINGMCSDIIDSRTSPKCKPEGHDQDICGWYVCSYCHSCCNNEGLVRRKNIRERTGQGYSCHLDGHREKGQICCSKCGTVMVEQGFDKNEYNRVLNWFIQNKDSSSWIIRHGKRKDGKFWFILKAPIWDHEEFKTFKNKLLKYLSIGFNVPDINEDKDSYLIGERFDNQNSSSTRILGCPDCGEIIDFKDNNWDKFRVMRHYHKQAFGASL